MRVNSPVAKQKRVNRFLHTTLKLAFVIWAFIAAGICSLVVGVLEVAADQNRGKAVYLISSFPVCIIVLLSLMLGEYAPFRRTNRSRQAAAAHNTGCRSFLVFATMGWDKAGNEYGTGYVIVSAHGPIPLGSYLDIDLFGEAQAMTTTTKLGGE